MLLEYQDGMQYLACVFAHKFREQAAGEVDVLRFSRSTIRFMRVSREGAIACSARCSTTNTFAVLSNN
jgi:hypothetical protein